MSRNGQRGPRPPRGAAPGGPVRGGGRDGQPPRGRSDAHGGPGKVAAAGSPRPPRAGKTAPTGSGARAGESRAARSRSAPVGPGARMGEDRPARPKSAPAGSGARMGDGRPARSKSVPAGSAARMGESRPARPKTATRPKTGTQRKTAAAAAVPASPGAPASADPHAASAEALATGVQTLTVTADEAGMRIDRFLVARFPQLAFTHIQRIVRKGELRVDGARAKPNGRLEPGQKVRIPPLRLEEPRPTGRTSVQDETDAAFLKSLVLYEDRDIMVLNKPMGLAVQGGSGMRRHVDGMLESLRDKDGQKPRLVHRLDKDTAGCLVIAKTRLAAATLAKSFRSRSARKVYWALVAGVPRVKQGRVSTYVAREEDEDGDSRMGVARHGGEGASHAVTYYAVVENSAQKLSWLSLKPVTGRTHQLRVHTAHIGHPIVGDPKYFDIENWELPGGIQKKLHLLARRIVIPHPRTGAPVDVTAPLPPHMLQTWNLLGFEADRFDPIVDSPDE